MIRIDVPMSSRLGPHAQAQLQSWLDAHRLKRCYELRIVGELVEGDCFCEDESGHAYFDPESPTREAARETVRTKLLAPLPGAVLRAVA